MHTLHIYGSINNPIPIPQGRPLIPGQSYIVTNAFAASILASREKVKTQDGWGLLGQFVECEPYQDDQGTGIEEMEDDTILYLIRGGGYGDLLMLTPMIRRIKHMRPDIEVIVCCGEQYRCLFDGLNIKTDSIPLHAETNAGNKVISYEEYIEGRDEATHTHMAQHFADSLGIDLEGDYRLDYKIGGPEMLFSGIKIAAVGHAFDLDSKKRIGVQLYASSLVRTYRKMVQVIARLTDEGFEVVVFGQPGQFDMPEEEWPNVINLTKYGLTFRESAAVLASCNAAVAPDSAIFHLAGALNVPVVGLYGPFPSKLRKTSKRQHPIDGCAECAPCFFHARSATEFPKGMPCTPRIEKAGLNGEPTREGGYCAALDSIEVEAIIEKVKEIAR